MSTEYANLGFRVDSSGLMTADQRLKNVTQSGRRAESQINMLSKTVGVAAAAFATFNASMSIKNTIFGFDTALKGLQATTRATEADMAKLEAQARQLGATSKFSATEAAEAQRFLAMAGFDTNKILASTPSVLKLATAGEISLAQAADMASNALGGMQLPAEELDRVIDVMAETAASANTNITQMADALSYAAPLAVSAGISVEEAAAAIGKLSDNGLQGSRAGTGLLGVIRQLSKPSSEAAKTLEAYGLTLDDVNIKSRGLSNVLKSVNDAGLDTAAMFTVFGSEAAPAAGILASTNEELVKLTERLGNATGSASEMSNIMAGSLTAGALGLSSALQEVALQIGDAGVAGGMKEAMLAATGFVHVFTGMLPEFAAVNKLTSEYVANLEAAGEASKAILYAASGFATLMGGKYISSLVAAEAAVIKQTLAQSASAKQTLAQAQAEVNLLRVQQQGFADTILRTKSEAIRGTLRKQLTGTTTALAAAEGRLATAQTAEAAAASRATVANIALNRARKVGSMLASAALGPWGLLAAAVGYGAISFMNAREESDKLNESLEKQEKEVSRLEKMYAAMNQGALGKTYVEMQMSAIEIDAKRAAAIAEITKLEKEREVATEGLYGRGKAQAAKQFTDAIIEQREKIEDLDSQADILSKRMGIVNKVFEDGLPNIKSTTSEVDNASESSRKLSVITQNAASSYAEIVKNLELERQQLILTSDEFEIYVVMQQASANQWTPAMTEQIIKQTKALQEQRKAIQTTNAQLDDLMGGDLFGFGDDDSTDKMSKDLDSLIDQVDNFGGAWTRTGNIIADSMGGAVSILDDFSSRMRTIEKLQADLTKEREEYADGTKEAIKIDESLARLQQESASAQIGAIGQTIGLSAQLFKENSKERKALHALEMGFMAVEIALAAEKAVVNAVSAVANQGQGDPYTAFGRIAAMIGIMGGVLAAAGIGFSGGGGGNYSAPTGGTGTVLGDSSSQSSSISVASERMEDIQTDQLSELMAIRQSMSKLSSGIQNLAKSFATGLDFGDSGYAGELGTISSSSLPSLFKELPSFVDPLLSFVDGIVGGIIGGFSSKKKKLIDSGITFVSQTMQDVFESGELDASMFQVIETTKKKFWGLSKSTSTNKETSSIGGAITSQMADIFGYIGDTVVASAESLGMDAKHIITTGLETLSLDEAMSTFVIDIGDVSFADKTGEEIQKELEAIFSQQADLMAQYLVPSITEYQQVGEGAFETLQRVAYEQAVFNDALDRTGVSLKDLSSTMQIDIAQSIISLVGGVDEFTELANSFFENFYSEAEQFNYLQKSISDVFAELGVGMVASREEFRNLVEGIDLTTESGQQLYAALMQISPAMDEYFNTLDDVARDKLNLQIELLEKQGDSEKALALQRQLELESMDESLHALMQQIWALDDAARAERERAQEIAEAEALLNERKNLNIKLLELQGRSEEALSLSREMQLSSLDESLHGLQKEIWAHQDLASAIDEVNSASAETVAQLEQQSSALSAEMSRLESQRDSLSGISDSLNELIYGAYDALEYGASKLDSVLKQARIGDFSEAGGVSTGVDMSSYNSLAAYSYARDVAFNKIAEIRDLSVSAEDITERSIVAIDNNMLELLKEIREEKDRAKKEAEDLKMLLEKMNKETVSSNKILKRIEQNTYEVLP